MLKELEDVKQKIAEIEKKIEEKKAETVRWKPQEKDEYYFVNSLGKVANDIWFNDCTDNKRYGIYNCFQSPEEAEFVAEKLKVIAGLKEFEEPKDRKWDGENFHYFFYYNCDRKEIDISYNYNCNCKSERIYFESKEKVRQAIDAIGEERIKKYYLEVEE